MDALFLSDVVGVVVNIINTLIPVLGTIALLLFLIAGARLVYQAGNSKARGKLKDAMRWSLIALFVLFSIWGILRFMLNVLQLGTPQQDPNPPGVQRGTAPWY